MESQLIPLSLIKPNTGQIPGLPKNPRLIKDDKFKKLVQSLKDDPEMLELRELIVFPLDGLFITIAGNMRLAGMTELKYTEAPCKVLLPATPLAKLKAISIKDNVNYGEFDFAELFASWDVDSLLDWGVDIVKTENAIQEDNFDADAYVAQVKEPITKAGDLYCFKEVGKKSEHRLLCGDSTKDEHFSKLLSNDMPRLIFTDAPYNVNYKSSKGLSYNSTKYGGAGEKIFNDNQSEEDCLAFYTAVLKNLYKYSSDDVSLYWWLASKNVVVNRNAWDQTGWQFSQQVIWLKNSLVFSFGQDYHRIYEPCFFGWKKGKKHYANKKLSNLRDCFHLDVDDFKTIIDVWYEKRDQTNTYVHPTQKPLRLAERALKRDSKEGDIVMDAFGGSGSTMLSCHQMNRSSRLIEMDPKFCDAMVRRFSKLMEESGGKFVITKNGKAIGMDVYKLES